MKNFRYIKSIFCFAFAAVLLTGCEESPGSPLSDFAGFEIGPNPRVITVTKDATESFDVKVYTNETTSSDRMFNVIVNMDDTNLASPYSIPSQVTIPGGSNEGTLTFSVTDNDDLGFEAQDLVIALEGFSGNEMAVSVTEECLNTIVTLDLEFDNWAEEASYEIYDLSGSPVIIYSGGDGGVWTDLDNGSISFDYCLPSGDYGIVVYDSYGDGGTVFTVTAGGSTLASGTVPGGNPANDPTSISATFTVN